MTDVGSLEGSPALLVKGPGMECGMRRLLCNGMQDTMAKQIEISSAIHLPFDNL
jgi:hypothetical protein